MDIWKNYEEKRKIVKEDILQYIKQKILKQNNMLQLKK